MADPFPPAPQSYASPYTPSLRERLIGAMQNAVGGTANQRGTASDFAENAGNVLGMVPGVSNVLGADDAVRQYQGGHPFQAAVTGAMALPIPGASAAEDAVEGPAQKLVKAITAYHGSPHSFDQFDMSKIGTGEGAQAYGHGLYFADSEGVARSYRDKLSATPMDGLNDALTAFSPYTAGGPSPTAENLKAMLATHPNPILQTAAENEPLVRDISTMINGHDTGSGTWSDAGTKAASRIDTYFSDKSRGHMYQVGINADPEHFLDWDKPLSEQPQTVQDFVANHPQANRLQGNDMVGGQLTAPTGENVIRRMGAGPETAQALSDAGIPGIKYLDQGSRNVGDGPYWNLIRGSDNATVQQITDKDRASSRLAEAQAAHPDLNFRLDGPIDNRSRNYVVFNQDLVNILKKYGLAGGAGLAGAGALMNQPQPAQAGQFPQAPPY